MNEHEEIVALQKKVMAMRGKITLLVTRLDDKRNHTLPPLVRSALSRAHNHLQNAEDAIAHAERFAWTAFVEGGSTKTRKPEEAPAPLSVAENKDGHGEKP